MDLRLVVLQTLDPGFIQSSCAGAMLKEQSEWGRPFPSSVSAERGTALARSGERPAPLIA